MRTITVLNNDKVYTYILVEEIPVSIGKGDGCDYVLPALSVDGPQLVIVWNSQKERIEVTRLRPDCEFLLDGKPLGDSAAVWTKQMKLTAGPYLFKHDLEEEVTPVNGDRFVVSVHHNDRHLALTPGRANECLMSVINNSAREVDGSVSVLIDGRSVKWVEGVGRLNPHFGANEDRAVALRFTAPRSSAQKAGNYRATISARSSVSDFGSGSDSINLLIEKFFRHELKVERSLRFNHIFGLVFRAARFNAKVGNQGNCPDSYDLMIEADADSKENTSYLFADTDSPQTELSVESGEARTTQVVVRPPLLWFPMWRRHNFSVQAISHGNHQALSEYGQQNGGTRPVRFTQFSVVWLILAAILLGWLAWRGYRMWRPPILQQPNIVFDVERLNGKPGDRIGVGDPIILKWKVQNASLIDIYRVDESGTRIQLQQDFDASVGEYRIPGGLTKTTDLVIIAKNGSGDKSEERRIKIEIDFEEANIHFLTPSGQRVRLDGSVSGPCPGMNIAWEITGKAIRNVTFDGETVKLKDERCKPVFPPSSSYDLVVNYNNDHDPTVRKFLVLAEVPTPTPVPSPTPSPTPPRCDPSNVFNVIWPEGSDKGKKRAATAIKKGDRVLLTWDVKGADSVRIMQDEGNGTSLLPTSSQVSGNVEISPQRRTTYTLILVKSGQEVVCKSVPVTVNCRGFAPNLKFSKWEPCK